jgi:hypothetical protein
MLYLIYGTDKEKARKQANALVLTAKKKHTEADFFKLTAENFSDSKLQELISNQGLFYSGSIVFADSVFTNEEFGGVVLKSLKEIKESPNFFVFLEEKLNKKELEKFEKYAEKVFEYKKAERKLTKKEELTAKGEKIDFFEFANALGERNKKLLWGLYQEALMEEVPSEEIHGIFFWQVKAMFTALKSKNAIEAGLKPFVFTKAKSYAKNYHAHKNVRTGGSEEVLKYLSQELVDMYHEAHRGNTDFAVALERFVLGV